LPSLLTQAIGHFNEVNGANPERIILFRDGVNDAQMEVIAQAEIEAIKAALTQLI